MRNSSKKKIHASSRRKLDWRSIDWKKVEGKVRELQMRIAKAVRYQLVTERLGHLNAKVGL